MKERSITGRRIINTTVKVVAMVCAFISIAFLAWILFDVAVKGAPALDWNFFTQRTGPFTIAKAGMANAIVGTLYLTTLAVIIGVPIGLLAGVYLSEFGKDSKISTTVRFVSNTLMGTPSILIGIFVYALLVAPMKGYSGYAGGIALGIMILPVVARTTEDMLRLVPNELRESALALGTSHWKTILEIEFRAARAGLLTGVLLAVARISGETAPLLFTAFNNNHFIWFSEHGLGQYIYNMSEPTPNLTVTIFQYAMSPYDRWKELAWGGAFVITFGVLIMSVVARVALQYNKHGNSK
jgi:phosphate transport system permease protein